MHKFHLSLNVSNLPESVQFLTRILGIAPAKQRADYAKFELETPPVVLSLEPGSPSTQGSLNHLGFRFEDSKSLVEAQGRLEAAGVSTQREDGVECCYAKQTKFWVHDGDHRLWEFYTLDEDIDHRGAGQALEQMVGLEVATDMTKRPKPVVWEHRMNQPFEAPAAECDEILLRGTFNVPVTSDEMRSQLATAFDALKAGGQITVHILTAEEPVTGELNLPGPAAYVKFAPVRTELMSAIEAAGFVDLRLAIFRAGACFQHEGLPLRETQIVARRPAESSIEACTVVFKGPFLSVTDDEGNEWRRGEPVSVSKTRWDELQQSSVADLFVLLPETVAMSRCGV